jgi:alkylation response protein AidB-like acyl-CoA dehydrogenase
VTVEATPHPDGHALTGTKRYVTDGHTAGLFVVVARERGTTGADGLTLVAVRADTDGVHRERLDGIDLTRRIAEVRFDGAIGHALGEPGTAADTVRDIGLNAAMLLAAELVGVAQRTLDMAVRYASERVQFGRPIGGFQAVKHICADMLLDVEQARSASMYATWAAATGSEDRPTAAAIAKAFCAEAAFRCALANIQVHGGIGFTYEHDAHLYYRRAKADELLFGSPSVHRDRIARALGI